jgi:hypothetical protein
VENENYTFVSIHVFGVFFVFPKKNTMTDINGYRSDGGGLGQDQGVSSQLKRILTSKLPLLNAPGTVIDNALYYDADSAMVTAVEMQNYFAKDRISSNNAQMGAAHTFTLPSVLFCGNVSWVCQLQGDARYANPTGQYPLYMQPHGWSFFAFRNILIYMGASTVPQLQINAYANFMLAMATCETDSKRATVLYHAGVPCINIPAGGNGMTSYMDDYRDGAFLFRPRCQNNFFQPPADIPVWDQLRTAVCPLRLPWCSMVAAQKRLSLDLKLSTQPIGIILETLPREQFIYMGRDLAANNTNFGQYASSSLQAFQQELSDKAMSVRNELLAMPEFNIALPFQLPQSIPFSVGANDQNPETNPNPKITMNITSIINSDLTTMMFMVVQSPTAAQSRTNCSDGNNFAPAYGEMLEEWELLLNGQQFFRFNSNTYDGVVQCLHMDTTKPAIQVFEIGATPNTPARAYINNFRSNIYELNFGRLRSIIAENHMQNTPRFTNQTFQLTFHVNRNVNWPSSILLRNRTNFVVQMVYLYNSVYLIGGDGGTTKLITN